MHSFARHLHGGLSGELSSETHGQILNWGWRYDLMIWFVDSFVLRGKLRELRRRAADLARIQPGETVLDVGCGTGTLAIEVKPRVGPTGRVVGIDPGTEQIARARSKAARRRVSVDFQIGVIERLAFPDLTFDVVLSTIMLHHLPDDLKRQGLAEIARVLKPGGRLVIADFKRPEADPDQSSRVGVGEIGLRELPAVLEATGFTKVVTGEELQLPRFHQLPGSGVGFVRAQRSA